MKITTLFAISVATLLLAGCTGSDPEQTTDAPATATLTETPTETTSESSEEAFSLPEGYPKVVPISELPENMQWAFESTGTGEAVAVAPGVWAELAPGATAQDAVNAGVFSGYCSSKEALEREYLDGQSTSGSCW